MSPILKTSSEATRKRLLDAGKQLFAEKGLEGARIDHLAEKARVNRALISYHFRGKEGLYRAVLEDSFRTVAEEMAKNLSSRPSPEERLRGWGSSLAEILAGKPEFSSLFLRELLAGGQHLGEEALGSTKQSLSLLEESLRGSSPGKEMPKTDPFQLHLLLLGGIILSQLSLPLQERLTDSRGTESGPDDPGPLPHGKMAPFLDHLIQRCFLADPGTGSTPPEPGEIGDPRSPEGE
ncbi:MAG: TetR/AcrR family transcriptional regulator [Candidatus Krumholzibacteria bacterium]|nr:TetR/AcrR family transcriptional regulator [Candidatus Krumholzibacteria bacterium]